MIRTLIALLALSVASPLVWAEENSPVSEEPTRSLLGYVEWITLEPVGLRLKARLDTGALTSSLHSVDTERFERNGEPWVRFRVPVSDHQDDEGNLRALEFERPLERTVLIKRKGTDSQRRYVVKLPVCINGQSREAEFSLTDRGAFNYPALLGRRVLADVAVVDPGAAFLATDECPHKAHDEFEQDVIEVQFEDQTREEDDIDDEPTE